MKKKFLIVLFSICLSANAALAGGFDDLGSSARAVSIGGAMVSLSGLPYNLFYNSAGISKVDRLMLSSTYSRILPGVEDDNLNYLSLSGALPLSMIGNVGVGATFFNSELWTEYTFQGVYAREFFDNFSAGASVKILGWSAEAAPGEAALSYFGFTFDAGAQYSLKNIFEGEDLNFGLSVRNITQPSISKSGSDDAKLPMILAAGFSFVSRNYNYLIACDFVKENDELSIKTGAEFLGLNQEFFGYGASFTLRTGYNSVIQSDFTDQRGLSAGFGLSVEQLTIDYAYLFPLVLSNAGGDHKISLTYAF